MPVPGGRIRSRWVWLAVTLVVAIAGGVVALDLGGSERRWADDAEEDAAASPASPLEAEGGRWRTYTDPDAARVVAPAPDGEVWVGTRTGGLVHWDADGSDYERHSVTDDGGRRGVHALAVADDGTVWAATHRLVTPTGPAAFEGAGVVRFDGQRLTTFDVGGEVPAPWVSSLTVDDDGRVWAVVESHAGTAAEGGVARFVDGRWTIDRGGEDLPGTPTSLAVDGDGAVWAASPGGVARFDDGQWISWRADGALPGGGVSSLSVGADGVWAATHDGVARFADGQWTSWTTGAELVGDWIVTLATAGDGRVWAVAAAGRPQPDGPIGNATLLRLDRGGWTAVAEVPYDDVRSLAVDGDGILWALTGRQVAPHRWRSGLARFDGQGWTAVSGEGGLPHEEVQAMTVGGEGAVWAATPGGVARFADGTWTRYVTGAGPPGERVAAVAVADDGTLWAGGRTGVSRLADGEWTSWSGADGLADDQVHGLTIGDDGTVWAATASGVSRFDGDQWTSWGVDDGLPHPQVRSVAWGGDGAVWAVTGDVPAVMGLPSDSPVDNAVARFDGERWTGWTGADAVAAGLAVEVTVDARGTPWVASATPMAEPGEETPPAGVSRFDAGEWTTVTTDDAIPGGDVAAIDAAGETVWVGTDEGLARYDGEGWGGLTAGDASIGGDVPAHVSHVAAVDAGTAWASLRPALALIDARDGIVDRVADVPFRDVEALAAADDVVWIGTEHGLVRFAPAVEPAGPSS